MAKTASVALRGSLNDESGYRHSAAQMQAVLAGLGDVDSASRTLAATIDLELPPVVLPPATDCRPPVEPGGAQGTAVVSGAEGAYPVSSTYPSPPSGLPPRVA